VSRLGNQREEKVFPLDSLFPYPVDLRVLDHVLVLVLYLLLGQGLRQEIAVVLVNWAVEIPTVFASLAVL
jgi:hypothetical protein